MNRVNCLLVLLLVACTQEKPREITDLPRTPVTLTHVFRGQIGETTEFNAYSRYLSKEMIRSPMAGYVVGVNAAPGDQVGKGATLFVLESQESRALKHVRLKNDSIYGDIPDIRVNAPVRGVMSAVNFREGGFVQPGDQLAEMIGSRAIIFVMNVPYEYRNTVREGGHVAISMSGGQRIGGTVGETLPLSTASTQVQPVIIHPDSLYLIPEDLKGTVSITLEQRDQVQLLERSAVMTNETQDRFWIMKLSNDSTAVRIPIDKGLETDSLVEIRSPILDARERILLTGQYGLPDTAYVKPVDR